MNKPICQRSIFFLWMGLISLGGCDFRSSHELKITVRGAGRVSADLPQQDGDCRSACTFVHNATFDDKGHDICGHPDAGSRVASYHCIGNMPTKAEGTPCKLDNEPGCEPDLDASCFHLGLQTDVTCEFVFEPKP